MSELILNVIAGLSVVAGILLCLAILLAFPIYLVHTFMPVHEEPVCIFMVVVVVLILAGLFALGDKVRYP